MITSTHYFDNS